jgi:hypothetical protein
MYSDMVFYSKILRFLARVVFVFLIFIHGKITKLSLKIKFYSLIVKGILVFLYLFLLKDIKINKKKRLMVCA